MKFNVLNETLYAHDHDDKPCNSYDGCSSLDSNTSSDKISDEISSDNIQKKKKSKNLNEKERNEREGQK